MSNMQAFHEWLLSTAETSDAYQRLLAGLTQASSTQLANIKSELQWFIWHADKAANA